MARPPWCLPPAGTSRPLMPIPGLCRLERESAGQAAGAGCWRGIIRGAQAGVTRCQGTRGGCRGLIAAGLGAWGLDPGEGLFLDRHVGVQVGLCGEVAFLPVSLTAVFAVYALFLLCTLLTPGSVSDAVGRRPAILAAMVIQAASTVGLPGGQRTGSAGGRLGAGTGLRTTAVVYGLVLARSGRRRGTSHCQIHGRPAWSTASTGQGEALEDPLFGRTRTDMFYSCAQADKPISSKSSRPLT